MAQGFDEYWDKENVRLDDGYHKHKETYDLGAVSRQVEIDELNFKLAEMKSRLNDAYTDGQTSMYNIKQSEIDALLKRVDKALEKCYTGIRKQGGDYYLELVQGILKGE